MFSCCLKKKLRHVVLTSFVNPRPRASEMRMFENCKISDNLFCYIASNMERESHDLINSTV